MSAEAIFTIVVVLLIIVWLVELVWLYRAAEYQHGDPVTVVSGAAGFFVLAVPVAQFAPNVVHTVGGFWESIVTAIFGRGGDGGSVQQDTYAAGPIAAAEHQARLLHDGIEIPLSMPRTRLGRYPNNELVIENSTVSAYHAEIIRRPDNRYEIVDRESRNGTRVNGALIRSQILKDGDLITLGGATLHFLSSPPPPQQPEYMPEQQQPPPPGGGLPTE